MTHSKIFRYTSFMTFYRAYRPQSFKELIGQENAVQILQNALAKGKVSHAYLLTGPRGTGKTSTARIIARAANCLHPVSKKGFEPCNECAACLAILNNRSTDLLEIDAASNRGIEDIRSLREQVLYPPVELTYKIYIIDEVHMLTGEAFNALLKTLEEPPSYCIFILATTELNKVPLTIRSRCQVIHFARGSLDAIAQKLAHIATQEKFSADPAALNLIAQHAEGGFRDAETLIERLLAQHEVLTVTAVEQALGLLPGAQVEQLSTTLLSRDQSAIVQQLADLDGLSSTQIERLISQLLDALRDRLPAASPAEIPVLTEALSQLLEAHIMTKHAPSASLPLRIACLNICQFNRSTEYLDGPHIRAEFEEKIEEMPHAIPSAVSTITIKTGPQPAPEKVPVVDLHQAPVADIRKAWKDMIEVVCRHNMVLGQTLKDTTLHSARDGKLIVQVRFSFHAQKLNEKKTASLIHTTLEELTSQKWQVEYEISKDMPRRSVPKPLQEGAAAIFDTTHVS